MQLVIDFVLSVAASAAAMLQIVNKLTIADGLTAGVRASKPSAKETPEKWRSPGFQFVKVMLTHRFCLYYSIHPRKTQAVFLRLFPGRRKNSAAEAAPAAALFKKLCLLREPGIDQCNQRVYRLLLIRPVRYDADSHAAHNPQT